MNNMLKKNFQEEGFTLIELIVSIFIFALITVAILAVFVSTSTAHQKANAIKNVKENVEYAMNLIVRDVRMGKIEASSGYSNGSPQNRLILTRNRGGKVCYEIGSDYVGIDDSVGNCASIKKIVDINNLGMTIGPGSAFYSCPSTFGTATTCPSGSGPANRRGWAEINLNIKPASGKEMEADQINVQTIISSRDYGWEETAP